MGRRLGLGTRWVKCGLQGVQVTSLGITLGRSEIAALAKLVPRIDQDDALGSCFLGVLVHPLDSVAQEVAKLARRAIRKIPAGPLIQTAWAFPGPFVPSRRYCWHIRQLATSLPGCPVRLDKFGVGPLLRPRAVAEDDVVVRPVVYPISALPPPHPASAGPAVPPSGRPLEISKARMVAVAKSSSSIARVPSTSSALHGSSMRRMSGLSGRSRAMQSFCCCSQELTARTSASGHDRNCSAPMPSQVRKPLSPNWLVALGFRTIPPNWRVCAASGASSGSGAAPRSVLPRGRGPRVSMVLNRRSEKWLVIVSRFTRIGCEKQNTNHSVGS